MKAWLPANIHTKEGFIRHKEHKQLLVGNQIGNLRHFSIDLNLNRIKPSNHCASFQVLPLQSALLWVGDYLNGALKVHTVFSSLAPSYTVVGEITHVLHRNSSFSSLFKTEGTFHKIVDPYRTKIHFLYNVILSSTYPCSNERVHFTYILALRNYVIWIPFILNVFFN